MTSGFTVHGGRLSEAVARHGGTPADWLDLSTGINPFAWPGQPALDWQNLPDPADLARLEALAACHFGVGADHCCAVPGSELALRLLADVLGLPGCHVPPCYSGHWAAFETRCAVAVPNALPKTPTVTVVANPNNPDGRLIAADDWLVATRAQGGWLILDEAFADSLAGISCAAFVADTERLIVLRSFGKFFGLAGARLGFVLAPRAVIAQVRRRLGDWPINAGALGLGLGAYADADWIAATRVDLAAHAVRLDAVLADHGLTARGACPLFRLVDIGNAAALFEALARRHILTRPFADHPRWLRFGLCNHAGLDRLDRALAANG